MQTELQLPHTASQVFLMTFHTQHQITFLPTTNSCTQSLEVS